MKKILFLFPYAPSYREPIYRLIDQYFDCDFHFCRSSHVQLKYMDYSKLKHVSFDLEEKMIVGEWCYYKHVGKLNLKDYDVILMTGIFRNLSEWYVLFKNRWSKDRKKVIFWTHATYGKDGLVKKWIKKSMLCMADMVLVYGHYAKDYLIEQKMVKADQVDVIYNSLDYDKHRQSYQKETPNILQQHFGNALPTLLFIGRLTIQKKLHMIIESIHQLSLQGHDYNLVLIGDGETREQLESLVEKYHLQQQVWFYGSCYDDEESAQIIKYADLCVSPGNVGLTAIHALTFGCPVITHDNYSNQMPEFEAIENGKTGLFFHENSQQSLTDTIQRWFDTHPDRKAVSAQCQERIALYYNPQHQLDILKKIL